MATYIVLGNYTDQGIRNIKDTTKRTEAVKEMAKKSGVTVKDTFWTLGAYDFVSIIEAPDDQAMIAFGMSTGALGNVRTQTLRAFPAADIAAILGKLT
ncbi:MAG TPA: GYD domain-containing protein [Xanthobacteraceae bacterium]